MPRALAEADLQVFLRRKRRGEGTVGPPPVGHWIAQTLELASRLVPCEAGSVLLDDPTRKDPRSPLTFVAAFGPNADEVLGQTVSPDEGIIGHVYATGEAYATDQPREDPRFDPRTDQIGGYRMRSVLAMPVVLENHVCGVFQLVNRRGPVGFAERDLELADLLARYVSRALLNAVDILKQNYLAMHDDLTGVRNVRGLDEHLEREVEAARREGHDLCVLFVDIDRLKAINDRFGHVAGSKALRQIGELVQATVGTRGETFRFGGDEFVVICPHMRAGGAEGLADELRRAVAGLAEGEDAHEPTATISVGVASLTEALREQDRDAEQALEPVPPGRRLLAAADRALYRAKNLGRNRVVRATRADDTLPRRR